jgi:hypothetical protein
MKIVEVVVKDLDEADGKKREKSYANAIPSKNVKVNKKKTTVEERVSP